jgi:hypothetical protein
LLALLTMRRGADRVQKRRFAGERGDGAPLAVGARSAQGRPVSRTSCRVVSPRRRGSTPRRRAFAP